MLAVLRFKSARITRRAIQRPVFEAKFYSSSRSPKNSPNNEQNGEENVQNDDGELSSSPKEHHSKPLNTILSSIEKFIKFSPSSQQEAAHKFIHHRLDETRFLHSSTTTRQAIFGNLISLLIHHRRFSEAGSVYQRMRTEYARARQSGRKTKPKDIPFISLMTEAQMIAIGLTSGAVLPETAAAALGKIFVKKDFSEMDFIIFVGLLKDLDMIPQTIVHVVRKWITSRGNDYTPSKAIVNILVAMLVRDGNVDEAFKVIAYYDVEEDVNTDVTVEENNKSSSRITPYATLISSLSTSDPLSQTAIDRVLHTIRTEELGLDSNLFAALIRYYAQKRDLNKAMSLYEALKTSCAEMGLPEMRPTADVYQSLWPLIRINWKKALGNVVDPHDIVSTRTRYRPIRRYPPLHRSKVASAPPTVSPRPLFLDMLAYLYFLPLSSTSKFDLDRAQSLLNLSLRAFLAAQDWAGAIVCLETLVKMGVEVNGRTYKAVVDALWEVGGRKGQDVLGIAIPNVQGNTKTPKDAWTELLLRRSAEEIAPTTRRSSHRKGGKEHKVERERVPTIGIINGTNGIPPGVKLSGNPLIRMLKRVMGQSPPSSSTPPDGRKDTEELIDITRTGMLPPPFDTKLFHLKTKLPDNSSKSI